MEYRTYVKKMKEQVQKHLGKDYEVQITTNPKLNGTEKTGLSISRTQEPQQVVPVIYLEECFERYLRDGGFAECVEEICEVYKNQKENEEKIMGNVENMRNWEGIKNRIYPMLVSAKENEELKETYLCKEYLDFLVLYMIRITDVGFGNIKITKQMLDLWSTCEDEVYFQALINMKTDGYQIRGFSSVIKEAYPGMVDEETEESDFMYVFTNQEKYFGAAGIFFCAEMFREIVGRKNFYILPSSVHELILVKDTDGYDMETLSAMVRNVNEGQVAADETLSNHAYYYDWRQNRITY